MQFPQAVPTLLQIGLILWAVFVVGGNAAVQAAVAIYLFVPRVVAPIQELITFYTSINNAWPAVEKVGMLLDEPLEVVDSGKKGVADVSGYDVALENVTFKPTPERTVLDNMTLPLPGGNDHRPRRPFGLRQEHGPESDLAPLRSECRAHDGRRHRRQGHPPRGASLAHGQRFAVSDVRGG